MSEITNEPKPVLTVVLDLDTKPALQKIEELRRQIEDLDQRLRDTCDQVER